MPLNLELSCERQYTKLMYFFALATVTLLMFQVRPAVAELSSFGDNNQVIEALGYGIPGQPATTGSLVIGRTDVGGVRMDVAFDPGPLISDDAIIGDGISSFGAVTQDGSPTDWLIDTTLIVGNNGVGTLDLVDAAKIQVGDDAYDPTTIPTSVPPTDIVAAGTGVTTLGAMPSGAGQITLTGLATRLVTADLIVGDLGVGEIIAQSRAAIYSGNAIIGSQDGSVGTVTLSDSFTRWTVGDPTTTATLTIGNGATTGSPTDAYGVLNIIAGAQVQTTDTTTINETGTVNLAGGVLKDINNTAISNGGVIRGDGVIDTGMTITATGQMRNTAATADLRENLLVTGAVTVNGNSDGAYGSDVDGLIESIGGEMEFHDAVTNNGAIVGRDAIMRFRGQEVSGGGVDLQNDGLVVLGGDSSVYGTVSGAGTLSVLSDSTITIVGDVIFTEPLFLVAAITSGPAAISSGSESGISFSIGDDPGNLTILGDLSLASNTVLELDYASSDSSQPGQSFQVLSADSITGTFANEFAVADGRFWDIDIMGDEIMATATALTVGTADFNSDGRVDGLDFMEWQIGYPSLYNMDDLARWEAAYGESTSSPPPVAAVAAVPEPSTLLLALSTLGLCFRPRDKARRRSS